MNFSTEITDPLKCQQGHLGQLATEHLFAQDIGSSSWAIGLDSLNPDCNPFCLDSRNDLDYGQCYSRGMKKPIHDWYLKEWLKATDRKQSDIVSDLDWNKSRVSLMVACKQQYTRDAVNELSAYLNIKPHELLMHPQEAMALRNLYDDAIRIVASVKPARKLVKGKKVSSG